MGDLKRRLMYVLAAQCVVIQPALARTKPSPFLTLGGKADAPKGYLAMCAQTPVSCDDDQVATTLSGSGTPIGPTAAIIATPLPLTRQSGPTSLQGRLSAASMTMTVTVQAATLRHRFGGFVVASEPRDVLLALSPFRYTLDLMTGSSVGDGDAVPVRSGPLPVASAVSSAAVPAEMSADDERKLLQRINLRVNRIVRQATDLSIYGREEVWQRSGADQGAAGDCEDMALEKQAELIAAGFPKSRLSLAVVYAPIVGLHTILVARTRDGDQVLDSRSPYLRAWWKSGYSWLSVQSFAGSKSWRQPLSEPQMMAATTPDAAAVS